MNTLARFLAGAALVALVSAAAGATASPASPEGPVVLTVVGNVAEANRPPFEPAGDPLLAFHEVSFARAVAFDRAMLEALEQHDIHVQAPGWPAASRFRGPHLADLLDAAGAQPKHRVRLLALDGYAQELLVADVAARAWLVALEQDGQPLALGGRGPTWVFYPPPAGVAVTDDDVGAWPWAVFCIVVE